jgi:leucyl aminopeptidase
MELPSVKILSSDNVLNSIQNNQDYDCLIVFFTEKEALTKLVPTAQSYLDLDATFGDEPQMLIPEGGKLFKRVLVVPTGSLYGDFDDVRRFKGKIKWEKKMEKEGEKYTYCRLDAAFAAGKRAIKAGVSKPLVCFADEPTGAEYMSWTHGEENDYQHYLEVTLLGLIESSFEPIDVRDHAERTKKPLSVLSNIGLITGANLQDEAALLNKVNAIETGRRIAKDIGNPDPEIMSPINIAKYIQEQFKNDANIKLSVIDDIETIKKEYPMAYAVTRASLAVPRHHPRIVHFEYRSPDQSKVKEK